MVDPDIEKLVWQMTNFYQHLLQIGELSFDTDSIILEVQTTFETLKKEFREVLQSKKGEISKINKNRAISAIATIELVNFLIALISNKIQADVSYENLGRILKLCLKNPTRITSVAVRKLYNYFCQKDYVYMRKAMATVLLLSLENQEKNCIIGFNSSNPSEADHGDFEFIWLYKMAVYYIKIYLLEYILTFSANLYIHKSEKEFPHTEQDRNLAASVIEQIKAEDRHFDKEFIELPGRVTNFEQAERVGKCILALCKQRLEFYESHEYLATLDRLTKESIPVHPSSHNWKKKNVLLDWRYFNGFVLAQTAQFHGDDSIKYEMMTKSFSKWNDIDKINDLEVRM